MLQKWGQSMKHVANTITLGSFHLVQTERRIRISGHNVLTTYIQAVLPYNRDHQSFQSYFKHNLPMPMGEKVTSLSLYPV